MCALLMGSLLRLQELEVNSDMSYVTVPIIMQYSTVIVLYVFLMV